MNALLAYEVTHLDDPRQIHNLRFNGPPPLGLESEVIFQKLSG